MSQMLISVKTKYYSNRNFPEILNEYLHQSWNKLLLQNFSLEI